MALLQSKAKDLGMACPDFSLPSVVDDKIFTLKDFSSSKALLVAFICNHCPYVQAIEDRLIALKRTFDVKDFEIVGICSNDAKRYPDDSKEQLKKRWLEKSYGFFYLHDADQRAALAFDAVCTPDFFLFDQKRQLFYHGQLDDNWQHPTNVKKQHLKEAIQAILTDQPPPPDQKPSMGCSIKWK